MESNKPVQIHKSHQNERKSKINFESFLAKNDMRLSLPWADNDYGIDGQVELISPIRNSENFKPDSKFFLIQLKSTEKLRVVGENIAFSAPVEKIIQWYSANVPVLLVLNDLKKDTFYIIWIDDQLIMQLDNFNSNWTNQKSITIKIPKENKVNDKTKDLIRNYVINWKISTKKVVKSGTYFQLRDKCKENIKEYTKICTPFQYDSMNKSIVAFNQRIEQAIYRIAITGPSRVGKSTLINALLKRKDISPTGIEQTTAVPIQVLPSKKNTIQVFFRNNKSVIEKFSPNNVKKYASQELNEDNKKEVSLVVIHLKNRQLEQGLSFFDIPGLDDPDENIFDFTWKTVTKANAILYLIDASVYEHGGYIFRKEFKHQLLELGQSLDKIFLVFTKVNALSGNKLELFKNRVAKDLEKLDLLDKVSDKIHYISAEESLEMRFNKKKGNDTVKKLEEDIWSYLLKESKTGLINLAYINNDLIKSIHDFKSILNTRLIDSSKRKELDSAILSVKRRAPQMGSLYYEKENEIKKKIGQSLEAQKNKLIVELQRYLKSIPPSTDFPSKKKLRRYLAIGIQKTLDTTNKEYFHHMNLQKTHIDDWIEENLKTVRKIISGNSQQKTLDFNDINKFEPPSIDLSTSFGLGFLAGTLAFIINPMAGSIAIFTGLSAFFGNLILSSSERRAKRILKTVDAIRRNYDRQFKKMHSGYMACIDENSKAILDYANSEINTYLNDISNQAHKLDQPVTDKEEKNYKEAFIKIDNLTKCIQDVTKEINENYSSI